MEGSQNPEVPTHIEFERKPLQGNILLIFGQGPVIDPETREKSSNSKTVHGEETVNLWLKGSTDATKVLFDRKAINDVVILGGRTGGKDTEGVDYKSEAEISRELLVNNLGISEDSVHVEDKSLDTIENIINFLNLYDQNDEIDNGQFSVDTLTTRFHNIRVKLLMGLFDFPVKNSFTSDSLLRLEALSDPENGDNVGITTDSSEWDNKMITELDRMHSMKSDTESFYKEKLGTESRSYNDRLKFDHFLIRELVEYPEKWLREVGNIKNDNRVSRILRQFDLLYPGMLKEKYQIEISDQKEIMPDIKKKLFGIPKYQGLSKEVVEKWQSEDWPTQINEFIENFSAMRKSSLKPNYTKSP